MLKLFNMIKYSGAWCSISYIKSKFVVYDVKKKKNWNHNVTILLFIYGIIHI